MRVLLAGATGTIGRHLIPLLVAAGHEVVGLVRTPGALADTPATELIGDATRRAELLAAVDGESFDAVVIQLTALRKSPLRFGDMATTNRLRTEGTSTMLAVARATGAKKVVAASIVYAYGFLDHGPEPLTEDHLFAEPTKSELDDTLEALLSLEQQVRSFGGTVLRYGVIYERAGRIPPVPLAWNGLLPFIHVEDAAAATLKALTLGRPRTTYNIVDDSPASWRDLQAARARSTGQTAIALPVFVLRLAAPFGSHLVTRTSMIVSNARAKRVLRWKPKYPSFHDALPESPDPTATVGTSP